MTARPSLAHLLLPLAAAACLLPIMSAAPALLLGVALALSFGNPYAALTKTITQRLLTTAVIGLGAGMNLNTVARVGAHGIGYTVVGICSTLVLGLGLARLLRVQGATGTLISVGTAICGGSAIAAVAPTIGAQQHEVSVALGTVFILNALALFIFPWAGHHFDLSPAQFGLWSALAIHDTSSVVGATSEYHPDALQIGTTVKLARALWIVPVTVIAGALYNRGKSVKTTGAAKRPWFILGFIAVAALVTWVPVLQETGRVVEMLAKRMLVLTLFFIGANLTRATLRSVGIRPFIQGVTLWICVASATLGAILMGFVH